MPRQTPDKTISDTQQYFRIGEVAEAVGVKPYVLRYWESEFAPLAPEKSRMKQRLYSRDDLHLVQLIARLLHVERFTIEGARKVLAELKGNWLAGLDALDKGLPPNGNATAQAPADIELQTRQLEKQVAGLEKDLQKKEKAYRDLKSAQAELTRELVAERQRLDRLLVEVQTLKDERRRLEAELKSRPAIPVEHLDTIEAELRGLLELTELDASTGPALRPAD
jgi:DNA-binding transcriptional MerR regulator